MMVGMEKELDIAKELAVRAGSILMGYYQRGITVDWKAPGDPVTAADREASDLLVSNLAREFPEHAILSEEAPDEAGQAEPDEVAQGQPEPERPPEAFVAAEDQERGELGLDRGQRLGDRTGELRGGLLGLGTSLVGHLIDARK